MHRWLCGFFISLLLASLSARAAQELRLVTSQAGRVGEHYVTSREVLINALVENMIGTRAAVKGLRLDKPTTREFIREASAVLLERAIFLEIESSATANIESTELTAAKNTVMKKMKGNSQWSSLRVESKELEEIVSHKLRAKKFIRFKVETSSVPISDREAKEYFDSNRLKFENAPFETFKETIKTYLSRQQVDRRLKDWYELLQVKYKIRNYLAE